MGSRIRFISCHLGLGLIGLACIRVQVRLFWIQVDFGLSRFRVRVESAALESIARSFGYHYGVAKKVRVNTVSQSPTKTTAGQGIKGFGDFFDFADAMAPLGNASAEQCADYCITLFSDLTRMVTMQNLYHDGGYSSTGVTSAVLDKMGIEG